MDNAAQKMDELDNMLKSERVITNEEYKSRINEIISLQEEIESDRKEFVNSLYDILRPDQVARYIIFERRFKNEIWRVMFKEHKPPDHN
jgi:hypothetical protein